MGLTQQKIDEFLKKYNGERESDGFILLGIRDESNPKADEFNDFIGYATKDTIELFKGTTDPGLWWTYHQMAPPHGAAHYKNGFHKDLFTEGWHYDQVALVQASPASIWRDDNKDQKFTVGIDFEQTMNAVMNLHHAKGSPKIYDWSAGCQVVQSASDHGKIMTAVRSTNKYKANPKAQFSYLLVSIQEV